MQKATKDELQNIPGVGPSISQVLQNLNVYRIKDLKGKSPEGLFARLCAMRGGYVDRCVLYVFRCAVYFAETKEPDPELLKWWAWKREC